MAASPSAALSLSQERIMGEMLPLLAGCRLMFTAVIMLAVTVVAHSGKAVVGRVAAFCTAGLMTV